MDKFDYTVNYVDRVAVAKDYFWQPIVECPLDLKVLLLSKHGVAVMGEYYASGNFTHWAPLPKIPKETK